MSIRVIQWATGAMGKTCLRAVIDQPSLTLVGLYAYGDGKVGRDAGDIAKRAPTGVIATNNVEEIVALDADVVIHAARIEPPYERHDGDILRLLASGKNVISINGNTWPEAWPNGRRQRFTEACRQGKSSFLGAGLNPGFAVEKLLALASGLSLDIESATISEAILCNEIVSPAYVFDVLGFGSPAGAVDPNEPDWPPAQTLNALFSDVVTAMASNLGFELDSIVSDHVMRPAAEEMQVRAGTIPQGGISHVDWRWSGISGGRKVANVHIAWAMDWQHMGGMPAPLWRIEIEGSPRIRIAIDLEPPAVRDGRTSAEQLGVAAAVVNAIPYIVAAPPGALDASFWLPRCRAQVN